MPLLLVVRLPVVLVGSGAGGRSSAAAIINTARPQQRLGRTATNGRANAAHHHPMSAAAITSAVATADPTHLGASYTRTRKNSTDDVTASVRKANPSSTARRTQTRAARLPWKAVAAVAPAGIANDTLSDFMLLLHGGPAIWLYARCSTETQDYASATFQVIIDYAAARLI
ncbi:hypothetical protein THASP1DRAFT_23875 [Thamnocephalis sphaerospora]|uniref:Secreted protein n=1 Tax=Thamnocephalis sphaerospora TaxID=78915 RepID=A0A4P9XQ92_9FUNG|nr:hypothetical protein THASP1DRAFT_23875 [Thamnocephalis sphaerospora]|eukprot:RKP08072.1 hypothetical protein THASP1DRAFT_23875 [Thamnocephalis sphaerospora]